MSEKDKGKQQGKDRDHDEKGGKKAQRTGNTSPDDPSLVEWLERLWTRGNPPERIEVWRVVGSNRDVRRALVFYDNFKAEDDLDVERCTKLAGEMVTAAQNDCDRLEKRSHYEIAVIDPFQKSQPLTRRLGPLSPVRQYALVMPDGELKSVEDEEDEVPGLKTISHRYLEKMFRSIDRTLQQVHLVTGDVMQLQQGIIVNQQNYIQNLQQANMGLYHQMQDAADRSLDREVAREREKMKTKAIGTGIGVGKNLLISWFGPPDGESGGEGQADNKAGGPKRHAGSREQRLVESFLEECKDEKLEVELFGDWKSEGGQLTLADIFVGRGLVKPGIFTPQQFGVLIAVRDGVSPPEALDYILPKSGHPQAISLEQMVKAQPLLSQSMFIALQQIRDLREMKREPQADKADGAQDGEHE